jgi:hypothetical protein
MRIVCLSLAIGVMVLGCMKAAVPPNTVIDPPPVPASPAPVSPTPAEAEENPLTALVSSSPNGRYSVLGVVRPKIESDGYASVLAKTRDTELGLQKYFNPWITSSDQLINWVDGSSFIWDGRILIDLEKNARFELPVPGPPLSWTFVPSDRSVVELVLKQGGLLEIWSLPLSSEEPRTIYSKKLDTAIGEISGRIAAGPDGSVYFSVPEAKEFSVFRLSKDGSVTPIQSAASNPTLSPNGRYLAYTFLPVGGQPSTRILDLKTSTNLSLDLPIGISSWSGDSKLIAVLGPRAITVADVPSGMTIRSIDCEGHPLLAHFEGSRLSFAEADMSPSRFQKVTLRQVELITDDK